MPWSVSLPRWPGLQRGKYSPLRVTPNPLPENGALLKDYTQRLRKARFPRSGCRKEQDPQPGRVQDLYQSPALFSSFLIKLSEPFQPCLSWA